jgi:hypothetical protein
MPASFHPARGACIINMYFTSVLLSILARLRATASVEAEGRLAGEAGAVIGAFMG